jgi:hypothetical protein
VEALSSRFPIGGDSATPLGDAPRPGYLFHADTIPFRHPTRTGEKYALILVDDFSRLVFIILMMLLSETVDKLKLFVNRLEAQFGRDKVIAQLRSDSASYFARSIPLRNFCNQKGIYQVFSPPYTQALNGVAERHVRTILDVMHPRSPHPRWSPCYPLGVCRAIRGIHLQPILHQK